MTFKVSENIEKGDILFFGGKKMTVSNFLWRAKYPNGTRVEHVEIMMESGEEIFMPVGLIIQIYNVGVSEL